MNLAVLNILPDLMLRGLGIYDRVQSDVQKRAAAIALKKAQSTEAKAVSDTQSDRNAIK